MLVGGAFSWESLKYIRRRRRYPRAGVKRMKSGETMGLDVVASEVMKTGSQEAVRYR